MKFKFCEQLMVVKFDKSASTITTGTTGVSIDEGIDYKMYLYVTQLPHYCPPGNIILQTLLHWKKKLLP
jgi:hypothetical protein